MGFTKGVTEAELESLVDEAFGRGAGLVQVAGDGVQTTLFGWLSAKDLGLPLFTVALGLLDGFNPCAMLREHSLAGSLLGIAALAVLVNFVELLCTAGLPAIYTSILARQQLSSWGRIGYLGSYNLAYVADDALMVTLAVATLSRRRLAERAGRWLKLASGAVMLALGILLIFRPEWLP